MPVARRRPAVSWMMACGLAAIAVGPLLAGCGSGSTGSSGARPTVGALVKTMQGHLQHAKSLRLSGQVPGEGKPLAVDLKLLRSGDSAGQMTLNGATFRFVRVGTKTYVDVTRSFFRYLLSSRRVPA